MRINDCIKVGDGEIKEFSMQILKERSVIPNLRYRSDTGGDFIMNNITGKKVFEVDPNTTTIYQNGSKFITAGSYIYEVDQNTGDIYRASYLYMSQVGTSPILLYNEDLNTYKNFINYLKEVRTDLVRDLFVNLNGTYVNFLALKDEDITYDN